jgi:hypothetical protein
MHEYEIRILAEDKTLLVMEEVHLCDSAAIRAGEKLAANRAFEVWRGLGCIFDKSGTVTPPKPSSPEAPYGVSFSLE